MNEESAEQRRLRLNRERHHRWISQQTRDTLTLQRRDYDARYQQQRRANETPEQAQARRNLLAEARSKRRKQQSLESSQTRSQDNQAECQLIHERNVSVHDCGFMDAICQFCDSRNFALERPSDGLFNSCCHKGKVKLMKP